MKNISGVSQMSNIGISSLRWRVAFLAILMAIGVSCKKREDSSELRGATQLLKLNNSWSIGLSAVTWEVAQSDKRGRLPNLEELVTFLKIPNVALSNLGHVRFWINETGKFYDSSTGQVEDRPTTGDRKIALWVTTKAAPVTGEKSLFRTLVEMIGNDVGDASGLISKYGQPEEYFDEPADERQNKHQSFKKEGFYIRSRVKTGLVLDVYVTINPADITLPATGFSPFKETLPFRLNEKRTAEERYQDLLDAGFAVDNGDTAGGPIKGDTEYYQWYVLGKKNERVMTIDFVDPDHSVIREIGVYKDLLNYLK